VISDRQHILEVSLGTKLKAFRQKAGLTQAQVAQAAGILQSVLTHYENDRKVPLGPRLGALAKALGATVEELLDDETVIPDSQLKPHIHGNSLAARIQDLFLKLKPEEQKAIFRQAEALLERRENLKDSDTPKRRRKAA